MLSLRSAPIPSGLQACGYKYIVIDDCWSVKSGRDGDGNLAADPETFLTSRNTVSVKAKVVGLLDVPKPVRNLWAQNEGPAFAWEMKQRVEPHQTILLKVG